MRTDLEIDKMLSELDVPELVALLHRVAEELELRFMEGQE